MEEASGTRVDSEPTGTPQDVADNATVTQTTGIIGNAAFFTAANSEFLSRADSADLSAGDIDFSATAWVKLATVGQFQTIIGQYGGAGQRSWQIRAGTTTNFEFVVSPDATASTTRGATTFGIIPVNTWCFIFAAHDSVNNLIKISVNNGTVQTTAYSTGVIDSASDFRIGANLSGFYVDGAIDEVGLWKKVLSAAEITELYNAGAGKTCCPF